MRRLFTLVLLLGLAAAGWLAYALLVPVSPAGDKYVMLRPGNTAKGIAAELERNGIIRDRRAFVLLHYLRGRRNLKAGEYRFSDTASAQAVYDRLARGDIYFHTVVIPEGYNMFDIALAMESAKLMDRESFLNLARTQLDLISDLDPQARSLEGYLFPDTYKFTRTQTPRDMIAQMVRRFREAAKSLGMTAPALQTVSAPAADSAQAGATPQAVPMPAADFHRIVTMASIIEKETAIPEERPLVAGVFYNRLKYNMTLATDPSVIYAALLAGKWDGVIHRSDLDFDHPYNTYMKAGLPPGPIANPGRASLEAALKPEESDYFYFVADANGRHRFARTGDEHLRNVALYRRALAAQQAAQQPQAR